MHGRAAPAIPHRPEVLQLSLSDGADVSLNAVHYRLVRPNGYAHTWEPLLPRRNYFAIGSIQGSKKENDQPDVLLWLADSWAGGENAKVYTDDNPDQYWQGLCNPRRPGQISPPPTKATGTFNYDSQNDGASGSQPIYTANASGAVWIASHRSVQFTTDFVSYSDMSGAWAANMNLTAICGGDSGNFAWVWVHDNPGGLGNFNLYQQRTDTTRTSLDNGGPGELDTFGLAYLNGKLYKWNGIRLKEYDTTIATGSWPVTPTKVFDNGLDSSARSTSYGGICPALANVAFFTATNGMTRVWAYPDPKTPGSTTAGLIAPLEGFSGRAICHSLGVVYIAGVYLDGATPEPALYAISLVSGQPLFLGFIRFGISNLTPVSCATGPGSQILIGMSTGEVFIYDAEQNAFSQLDTATLGTGGVLRAVNTYGGRRYALSDRNTGTTQDVTYWKPDDDVSSTTTGTVQSPITDLNVPEQNKILEGFDLTFKALTAGQSVAVSYALDDNTDAPVYTSAGTANTVGTQYATFDLTASSTLSFRTMRYKITLTAGAIVYSCMARVRIKDKVERFKLVLKCGTLGPDDRFAGKQPTGQEQIANVRTLAAAGNVFTFVDGAEDGREGQNNQTYRCVIEQCEIDVTKPGEGVAQVGMKVV